jgi:hypothetical protein
MAAATYRDRLALEGYALAACGVAGSAALVAFVPASHRWPWNTVGQLAAAGGLIAVFGTRAVRGSIERAVEVASGEEGSGEPTPLWHLPLVVTGLAAAFALLPKTGLPASDKAGWDAALRITGGCLLVGLVQGLRFERIVARDESRRGRRYIRVKGSHLWSGTKLGWVGAAR